jgi:riboflavin kinase/FMN adenylyltransferase
MGAGLDFQVEEIHEQLVQNEIISSTLIRNYISDQQVKKANDLLGYAYCFEGFVVRGNQLGRTIGYPTANLHINDEEKLIPANGVYAVKVKYSTQMYEGMLSIGKNPTVTENGPVTIEVNIFDFNHEIYHKEITIYFYKKLRDEVKYNSINELKSQLAIDKENALKHL